MAIVQSERVTCQTSGEPRRLQEVTSGPAVREEIVDLIRKSHPK